MSSKCFEYFKGDNFARENGIELVSCSPGHAIAKVEINERHLNGAGVVHGGLLFTLADFAFAAATNSYGKVALSINASINFFEKSNSGTLIAEATEISRSNKLIHCDINIRQENGSLLANFKGTAYVTKTDIEF
ncbi:MAG: PaaI family thioesterase [Paludibacter sp.]|nr:PaaI family thioesterase [Paludibacter sp.]